MSKEYVVEKAFRPKNEAGVLETFTAHDKVMWPWIVKVEGEDFWFKKNTLENNAVTPGDTMYGMFDEEETEYEGKKKTKRTFVKRDRPDGEHDKVQSRDTPTVPSEPHTAPLSGLNSNQVDYMVLMLEELTGRRKVSENPAADKVVAGGEDVSEEETINLDDINF